MPRRRRRHRKGRILAAVVALVVVGRLAAAHPRAGLAAAGVAAGLAVLLLTVQVGAWLRRRRPGIARVPIAERGPRSIPQAVKIAVAVRDRGRCRECGATDNLQYDHIHPWSRGGPATVDNIQLMCGRHNLAKSDRIPASRG